MENLDLGDLIILIKENLDDSLLKNKYLNIKEKNKFTGHCYVASETLYYLSKMIHENYKPAFIKINNDTHWFLKNKNTGEIIDITSEQFNFKLDYSNNKNASFLTNYPSKRCVSLMNKIIKKNI